jgi:hypothetical protein
MQSSKLVDNDKVFRQTIVPAKFSAPLFRFGTLLIPLGEKTAAIFLPLACTLYQLPGSTHLY